jgi:hypothetical protein
MALQSKTLLNDVGSAVLVEAVSQLNRASGYIRGPNSAACAAGATEDTVLCVFEEDVLVTQVTFSFAAGGNFNDINDDILLVTGTATDGSGGTEAVSALGFDGTDLTAATFHTMSETQATSDGAITGVNVGQMPFAVDAGDALTLRVVVDGGSAANNAVFSNITIAYRPFKDALNLEPAFTPKMANFRSVTR